MSINKKYMNKHIKSRMQHEIGSLYQTYNNINVVFQPEKNTHKITIQNNKDTIVFLINDMMFPFHPPNLIYINDVLYRDYIKTPTYLQPYMVKLNSSFCFCCDTVINKQIWQPAHGLMHIMNELKFVKTTIYKATILHLVDQIKEKNGLPEFFDVIEDFLM